jgi:proteasome accessory factor C
MAATAAERVERILSILPWIAAEDGADVDEVCARFGLSRTELEADLDLLFYEVGIHPFTPDARVDVEVEDNRIRIHHGDYFRRPLRPTHDEALALLAAGRAALDQPDADPHLFSAVRKLADALGPGADRTVDVHLGRAHPEVLAAVRRAVDERRRLVIDYYSFARDRRSSRVVDPQLLRSEGGHWYLLAFCHRAGAWRWFRVDRIVTAEVTDEVADTPAGEPPPGPDLAAADQTVELVLGPEGAWVAETYPTVETAPTDDGRLRVVLRVTARPWLERLLLRLGPGVDARDADTGEPLAPLAAAAADRLLARYEA